MQQPLGLKISNLARGILEGDLRTLREANSRRYHKQIGITHDCRMGERPMSLKTAAQSITAILRSQKQSARHINATAVVAPSLTAVPAL